MGQGGGVCCKRGGGGVDSGVSPRKGYSGKGRPDPGVVLPRKAQS